MKKTINKDGAKQMKATEDYRYTWELIDRAIVDGKTYEYWQSNHWGEDAGAILTAEDGEVLSDGNYSGIQVAVGDYLGIDYESIEVQDE